MDSIDSILKKYNELSRSHNYDDKIISLKNEGPEIICLSSDDEDLSVLINKNKKSDIQALDNSSNPASFLINGKDLNDKSAWEQLDEEDDFPVLFHQNNKYELSDSDESLPCISLRKSCSNSSYRVVKRIRNTFTEKQKEQLEKEFPQSKNYKLSDSDDSLPCISPRKNCSKNSLKETKIKKTSVKNHKEQLENELPQCKNYELSDSGDSLPCTSPSKNCSSINNINCLINKKIELSDGDESLPCISPTKNCPGSSYQNSNKERLFKGIRKTFNEKQKEKLEKEKVKAAKLEERNKIKAEKEKEKINRKHLNTLHKNLKPEECLKTITVNIDPKIAEDKYGGEILNTLQTNGISIKLSNQKFPGLITWNRQVQSQFISENGQLSMTSKDTEAKEILYFMNWKELIDLVYENSFISHIKQICEICFGKKILIGIYGLQSYYKFSKNKKQKEFRMQVLTKEKNNKLNKTNQSFINAPVVSRKDLENVLTELQILYSCSHKMIETTAEVAQLVFQITKAIAQIPYKLEKRKKEEKFQRFISGENRDCVNVDRNGNGLQRLWSQQLTMFPFAGLETAEAIISKYPTPNSLMKAYEKCQSKEEGEKLLQDIAVRRAAGPLANERRIGIELSRKFFKFFTCSDENDQV